MKKIEVVRDVATTLHGAEQAVGAAVIEAKKGLQRLKAAKAELGLTGTLGDAAIARWAESVATLEAALDEMMESHGESYRIMQMLNLRSVAAGDLPVDFPWPTARPETDIDEASASRAA